MNPDLSDELSRWKKFSRFHETQALIYRNELESVLRTGELIPRSRFEPFEPYLRNHLVDALHLSRSPLTQFFTPQGEHDFERLILWLEGNGQYVGP
jgi:hypothetical protein